jgi:Ca2+-binding RTX toxin-like protein
LSFANITTGVSVDLLTGTGTGTVTGIDSLTVSNFETLVGTGKDDALTDNATTRTNIQGGAGNDTITGGTAADTLSGGAGSDKFVIVDAAQGLDHIVDFAVGDKLQVSQSGFAHGLDGLAAGALTDATYFKSGAGVASDASGHGQFLYDTTSHDLSWDADGAGGNGATTIAHFDNNYVVKITDFLLS